MKDDEKYTTQELHDPTIAPLLTHLQQMRKTVPVNYELKAQLKKKLLEQMKQVQAATPISMEISSNTESNRIKKWWLATGVVALTIASAFLFWSSGQITLRQKQDISIKPASAVEQVAISARGEKIAYVGENAKLHTYLVSDSKEEQPFSLPMTKGHYDSPAWANHSDRLAVIENTDQLTRLWIVEAGGNGAQTSSRLLIEHAGMKLQSVQWSPTDQFVTYTKETEGRNEIWMSSTSSLEEKKIAEGSDPAWAPDGNSLAFAHDGKIWLMNMNQSTGEAKAIGEGSYPSWAATDRLTYTSSNGELMDAEVNKDFMRSTKVQVPQIDNHKIKRASWIKNGTLLFVIKQKQGDQAISYSLLERD